MRSQSSWATVGSILRLAILLATVQGCERGTGDRTASTSSTATASTSAIAACQHRDSVRSMSRDRFIDWARGLSYHGADATRGTAEAFDAADSVRVEAAQGMDTVSRAELARGCVIARIIASGSDAGFGIKADTSYVWADSTNSFTATIVPDDGTSGVVYNMAVDSTGGTAPTTTTIPKHVCSECGRNDWCVYPRDEIRLIDEALIGSADVHRHGEGTMALASRAVSP